MTITITWYSTLILGSIVAELIGFLLLLFYREETFNLVLEEAPNPRPPSPKAQKYIGVALIVLSLLLQAAYIVIPSSSS